MALQVHARHACMTHISTRPVSETLLCQALHCTQLQEVLNAAYSKPVVSF